jgi:hypothetical protein
MNRSRRRVSRARNARTLWHPRACERRAVALRVDYVSAQGQASLGLVRNLSAQGMYIDHALRHVAPVVAPGDQLTVAFALPSGRPCKLRAVVIHGDRHGWGVQFLEGAPPALAHLAHDGLSREAGDDRCVRQRSGS